MREINIWEDQDAAGVVRSLANGNETVPTVTIGDISLVNPSARQVVAEVKRSAPESFLDDNTVNLDGRMPTAQVVRTVQWILIGILIACSITADLLGHNSLSWGLDAVALATYVLFRLIRRNERDSKRVSET